MQRIWKQGFFREEGKKFLSQGSILFIDRGVETSLLQIPNQRKSRSTSQDPRLTESAWYRLLLPHDLSHYGTRIQKDTGDRFQANLIDRRTSCYLATQSPSKIQKIHIAVPDPLLYQHQEEFKAFKRSLLTLLFWLPFYRLRQTKERGASVVTLTKMLTRVRAVKFLIWSFHII